MFEPVSPVRAYERVVEQIEEAVFTGRLRPGSRLPSERDLMTQFGVSRSTVREALRVLQSNGMVQSRAGDPRGPEVLPASPKSLQKSMSRLVRAESMSLAELLQFRMLLEGSAYLLAAQLRTDAQLAEMEAALTAMTEATEHADFSAADVAFHDAVARATQNTLILVCSNVVRGVVLDLIADHLATASDRQKLMLAYLQHHSEVLQAIRDRDGALAARLAREALYDYYADSLPVEARKLLAALVTSS
ncbi:FadR family transcriptional regulator [Kibdelosporangium philippinense]|uniref:FadR family transcriptional regulator n=1 Tax=Kibdelosporangium philippinense TaxID=211113 RepID=A0ABS8ZMG6_9PSEU|nr:FadR/GntR family transcriptional regulator [Kibdelosporangium philippinense]MCE7008944.1 FadR family transcriptional regulator [Kibdelosporangium philippinense]